MITDPFVHLPDIRGRLVPVDQSTMRFTREVLTTRDARALELGYPANWRQSDQQIEGSWRQFLAGRQDLDDLWVFGYGSLLWDPAFHFAEVRRADIEGYQRRFPLKIDVVTGSPAHPGRAMSLEPGSGLCSGLAFRIEANLVQGDRISDLGDEA